MALSARASALLASFPRHPYVGSARTMEYVFAKAGLPLFEPVITFQQQYAGYELITMHRRSFPHLQCGVIHHKPLPPTRNPLVQLLKRTGRSVNNRYHGEVGEYKVDDYYFRVMQHEGRWFFGCTDDWFEGVNYIDEGGKLYSTSRMGGNMEPWLITSSMDKYMEKEAFERTIFQANHQWKSLCSINIQETHWDELVIKWNLILDEDASDSVSQIWFSNHLWAEGRKNYIHFWSTPLLDEPRKQYLLRLKQAGY